MESRPWLVVLFGLAALPAFAWEVLLIYQQLTLQIPHLAAMAGLMGVIVGFVSICGYPMVRWLWAMDHFSAKASALCLLLMTALFLVMRETGEFGPRVYAEHVPYFTQGFQLGVLWGVTGAFAMLFPEK